MKIRSFILLIVALVTFCATANAETFDSIQPTENIYQSIVKPNHNYLTLNLISNFGDVEVPTSTIITHANNDFKILRFEKDAKGFWHLAKKDTVLGYTEQGSKITLNIQRNLAIKKTLERVKMIIVINVPSFWALPENKVRLALNPWTLDRVGRLQEYTPGSMLDWERNFKGLYNAIRENAYAEPGQRVSPEVQKSFDLVYVGDIYISKGLLSKLVSRSYVSRKYLTQAKGK